MNLLKQLTESTRTAPSRALAAVKRLTTPVALAAMATVGATGCGTIQGHGGLGHIAGSADTAYSDCEPGSYNPEPIPGMKCESSGDIFVPQYICYEPNSRAPRCKR